MDLSKFHYSNVQKHGHGSTKKVRKVIIQKGKGYKSISFYKNGKLTKTIKRPLLSTHIEMIKKCQFIPGLFNDCKPVTRKLTRR
uniref:Uncharacterized protein n=1 Tax=viral metagenome TaxID=1070528 RepID=A0A6C0E5X2_9ZZZZ